MEYEKVKFKELKIGDKFECYGDSLINYDYPKICKCIKTGLDTAEEINGVSFYVDDTSEVFTPSKDKK